MQDFHSEVPSDHMDLAELTSATINFRLQYTNDYLNLRIEDEVKDFDPRVSSLAEREEDAFYQFQLEQTAELADLRERFADQLAETGLDIVLEQQSDSPSGCCASRPEFLVQDGKLFERFLTSISMAPLSEQQQCSLSLVLRSVLSQVWDSYRIDDPNDDRSFGLLASLSEISAATARLPIPQFAQHSKEFALLTWLLKHQCTAEVVACIRSGAFSVENLLIFNDELILEHQKNHPPCFSFHAVSDSAESFNKAWKSLERRVVQLKSYSVLSKLHEATVAICLAALSAAKADIIPDSSVPDDPGADLKFRGCIDHLFDRFSENSP